MTITDATVVAYSQCQRKAYLLLNSADSRAPHEYVRILEEQAHLNRIRYLDSINQKDPGLTLCRASDFTCGKEMLVEVPLKFQDLCMYSVILPAVSVWLNRAVPSNAPY